MTNKGTNGTIGKRIAIARNAAGLNQDQVAEAINVHKQTISRWKSGKRVPNGEEIRALAVVLGCSGDFLLGITDTLIVRT